MDGGAWRATARGTTHKDLDMTEQVNTAQLGDSEGQGSLVCCSSWDFEEPDRTQLSHWTAIVLLLEIKRSWLPALSLSHVQLFLTLWTVACHTPLSMEFSRQEYWSGLPFPSPSQLFKGTLFDKLTFHLISESLVLKGHLSWLLEKEIPAHSSILAWRIPRTGEPRGLQSMGSQRVRHVWMTKQQHWLCQSVANVST